MAVITKFFIVRDGVELDKVFTDKKAAEGYDKMLDAADKLADLIRQAELPVKLDDTVIEEISVCLAKNAPEVSKILKSVKPVTPLPSTPQKPADETTPAAKGPAVAKKSPGKRSKAEKK
jgi:dsDNA-binding SOS-regulon protein